MSNNRGKGTMSEPKNLSEGRVSLVTRLQNWWHWHRGAPVLFRESPLPMWIYDKQSLRFLDVNECAVKQYGYSREEFLEMTLSDIRAAEEAAALETSIQLGVNSARHWKHVRKDGSSMLMKITSNKIRFRGRDARFVVAEDVTERVNLHRELVHIAHHDGLTGLPNRLLLERKMKQVFADAAKRGGRAAVICLDLDRFKQINDRFGHAGGDECLKQVATMLTRRLRGMDTVARTGGEEFTLVLGEIDGRHAAEKVCSMLLRAFQDAVTVEGTAVRLCASMGVAVFPDDGRNMAELQRAADAAMYRAKRTGGNRYVPVSPGTDSVAADSEAMAAYMQEMLRQDRFELHYQPQYTPQGEIRAVEALLRLPHPTLGYVSSDRFIPIAEENSLIEQLGLWVLRHACEDRKRWKQQFDTDIRIAVNVSPLQLRHSDFPEQVLALVKECGMDPGALELEITEGVVLNFDDVVAQMRRLSRAGITFAVDDFGVGYSSLQHLHRLPISTVKIDRSFSQRICEPGGTFPIVEAIVAMGHSLGMTVVAEGVETRDQLREVTILGCDLVQGYLCSMPVPAHQIPALLLQESNSFGGVLTETPLPRVESIDQRPGFGEDVFGLCAG